MNKNDSSPQTFGAVDLVGGVTQLIGWLWCYKSWKRNWNFAKELLGFIAS